LMPTFEDLLQGCQIWVDCGGSSNGRGWYILRPFGLIYGHFVQFVAISYICWSIGIFSPVLVSIAEKIWQPWFAPSNIWGERAYPDRIELIKKSFRKLNFGFSFRRPWIFDCRPSKDSDFEKKSD
jgi:polyferredoxin